jgi:hypothetical protein
MRSRFSCLKRNYKSVGIDGLGPPGSAPIMVIIVKFV